MGRLDDFAPQAVSNTLWGCATLDFYHDEFFEAACAHIKSAASQSTRTAGCLCAADSPDMHDATEFAPWYQTGMALVLAQLQWHAPILLCPVWPC